MSDATKTPATIEAAIADTILTLQFSNGKHLTIDALDLTDAMRTTGLMHGLKQKLVDAAAIARNTETGRSATVADKFAAVEAVYLRLLNGDWNAPRGEGTSGGLLLRALCQIHDGRKTREQLTAYLATKTDEEKAALRRVPSIAAVIATLRPEPKTDGIDTAVLEAELAAL